MGLATLTHTPSPMAFLSEILAPPEERTSLHLVSRGLSGRRCRSAGHPTTRRWTKCPFGLMLRRDRPSRDGGRRVTDSVPLHLRPPRAAYVHVPFCAGVVVTATSPSWLGGTTWCRDTWRLWSSNCVPRSNRGSVDTLFLGGGTPTQLPAEDLERLLRLVLQWFPLTAGGEFSVEANPDDLRADQTTAVAGSRRQSHQSGSSIV